MQIKPYEQINTKEELLNYMKKYYIAQNKNPFFRIDLKQCIFQNIEKNKKFSRNRNM